MESIAAQLYTVREFCKTPADIADSLRRIGEIGYRAIQVSGIGPIEPAELRELADAEALQIVVTHTSFDRLDAELDELIEEHRTLGCGHIAIGALPKEMREDAAGFSRFAAWADDVGARITEAGMTFSYHNHAFEMQRFDGRLGLDILLDETDPDHVKFELDTYWVQAGGGDPAEYLGRMTGRAPLLHVKDMIALPDNTHTFAEVGEGNLNWPAIVKAARAAGAEWYIVEQDTCAGDPFDSLKISLENLRSMGIGEE